jgi:TolB protein
MHINMGSGLGFRSGIFGIVVLLIFAQFALSEAQTPISDNQSTNKILFHSTAPGAGWELFTVNPDGTDLKQLTSLNNLIGAAQWSPDGQYIAFTTFASGISVNLILNVMKADGSDIRQLSDNATTGIDWSPDSQQIAFTSKRDDMQEIYLINRDGSGEKRLTHGSVDKWMDDVYGYSWSPDGQQIAFVRSYQLYIINADGSEEKPLLNEANTGTAVAWSPDGRLIAYTMRVNQQVGIYTILPDGSNIQKILDIPSDYTGLVWSPNGQYLSYTQKDSGVVSLFIVDADGNNNHQLADNIIGASWSPDSKYITYSADDANFNSTMYIVEFSGQNQTVLPGNNEFDHSPLWSPN